MIHKSCEMDVEVSYLHAIQEINGRTPAEKYREVNNIVRQIIDGIKESGDFGIIAESPLVPKPLIPLLHIIVGKALKNHDAVITALKSSDIHVVKQALWAQWFYTGSNKSIVNFKYFSEHVLPYISIKTRTKIITNLAVGLAGKEFELAQEFFNGFVDVSGIEQATPLLAACSEDFIYEAIIKHKITLSNRLIRSLFRRYPNLVIRYLQLGNINNEKNKKDRELRSINLYDYVTFLPRLIRGHANVFAELYELNPMMPMKLGITRTALFLNNAVDILINKPTIYLKIMPLERVCYGLTLAQFEIMFANLFPKDLNDFNVDEMLGYLKYYPEDKKINLLRTMFEQKYNLNFFDDIKRVTRGVLLALSAEERVKHTKRILKVYPEWSSSWQFEWRCFLPVNEALTIFKSRISKFSQLEDRADAIACMIYSCKINDSKEALLDVLRYYNENHKNEQPLMLFMTLGHLLRHFDIENLSESIWIVLREIIQRAHVKNELFQKPSVANDILEKYIHFLFIQTDGKPIENYVTLKSYFDNVMKLMLELRMEVLLHLRWNIVKEHPEIEKYFLEQCLLSIPIHYNEQHQVWKRNMLNIILNLVISIGDYNTRNVKRKIKHDPSVLANEYLRGGFSVKNYPWLIKYINQILKSGSQKFPNKLNSLKQHLKKLEPELYGSIAEKEIGYTIENGEALEVLRRDHNQILDNWEKYLDLCRECSSNSSSECSMSERSRLRSIDRFVKATVWYKDIPIKFAQKCLAELTRPGSITVLSSLLDGETFARLIEPFTPTESIIDISRKDAKDRYKILCEISSAVNYVNPPVPLNILSRFCQGDFMSLALRSLENVARRISVTEVIRFTKELVDNRISIKKHGFRIACLVGSKNDLLEFLSDAWKREKHKSIREILLNNICDFYCERQNDETHKLMIECISSLTLDDESIFEKLIKLVSAQNKYVGDIVEHLLSKLDCLQKLGLSSTRTNGLTCLLLDSIEPRVAKSLPEQVLQETIRKYFLGEFNLSISSSVRKLMIEVYLLSAGDMFDTRIDFIGKLLEKLYEKWNQPDMNNIRFYPANYVIHQFFTAIVKTVTVEDSRSFLTKGAIKIYSSILTPRKDPKAYLLLVFCQLFHEATSPKDFGVRIGRRLAGIVEEFSTELILTLISDLLESFLQPRLFANVDFSSVTIEFLEGLVSNSDTYSEILCVRLLNLDVPKVYDARYDNIVRELRTRNNAAIEYMLYRHVNSYKNINLYLE